MQQTSAPGAMSSWIGVARCWVWFPVGVEYPDVGEPGGDAGYAIVLPNGRCIEHDLATYDPHLIGTWRTVTTGVTNEEW